LKWSGTPVSRRVNLLVPSQAGSLSPSCPIKKWRKAEGTLPTPGCLLVPFVFKTKPLR